VIHDGLYINSWVCGGRGEEGLSSYSPHLTPRKTTDNKIYDDITTLPVVPDTSLYRNTATMPGIIHVVQLQFKPETDSAKVDEVRSLVAFPTHRTFTFY
jgi:hypothetical protein